VSFPFVIVPFGAMFSFVLVLAMMSIAVIIRQNVTVESNGERHCGRKNNVSSLQQLSFPVIELTIQSKRPEPRIPRCLQDLSPGCLQDLSPSCLQDNAPPYRGIPTTAAR